MKVSIPDPAKTYVISFPRLDGGLNIKDLSYRLENDQSPEMKNLWWQDGILQCRDGQQVVCNPTWENSRTAFGGSQELFNGNVVFHIGSYLYRVEPRENIAAGDFVDYVEIASGVPLFRGTFFKYDECLYYKTRGAFLKIDSEFNVTSVLDDAYVPTIVMNASPSTGSGDLYQPENRLSPKKTVQYNAAQTTERILKTADGTSVTYTLGKTSSANQLAGVSQVYFGASLISELAYTVDISTGKVTFAAAPAKDTQITFFAQLGVTKYQLPVKDIDSVDKVVVDGKEKTVTTDYTVNKTDGTVTFKAAPPVTNPPTNNTVEITYSKENTDAKQAIMDCQYAALFSGGNASCVVMGGSTKQPNAFFWNGNDSYGMNIAYWPESYYNLAGETYDAVTGFGLQYGALIVLKENSVGRADFEIVNVEQRDAISLTYTSINDRIGCDLPWSIQLIENNIVFAKREGGVYIVRDASAALENTVTCISDNVNGTEQRPGLLKLLRGGLPRQVCSFDDGTRYWLCKDGDVYLWDYSVSNYNKPSWFYFDNIKAASFFRFIDATYHLDSSAHVVKFVRSFKDYDDTAIDKVYQFPPQFFDTYDRLKDVTSCIFVTRSDTNSSTQIWYETDYEKRQDLTNIKNFTYKLSPRNLAFRYLATPRFASSFVRRPGCRHVRHFAMRLQNNEVAQDLAIVSAQIYFRYTGRDR